MKILLVKNSVVPPKDYGGTERVVFWLAKSLKSLGHQVTILAAPGSGGTTIPTMHIQSDRPVHEQIPSGFDLVHFHDPYDGPLDTPYINTIHGVADPGETYSINSVFVSHNQAACHGAEAVVYHGLDFSEYGIFQPDRPRNYIHFLAKTRWKIKNIVGAVFTANQAGARLEIMGNRTLESAVLKYAWRRNIHFNGMAVGALKNEIMAGSAGLLFPTLTQETFGLSMIESMYHGCPVFGTPYGSLPELIGKDIGVLSASASELSYAIKHAHDFDRKTIHREAIEKYDMRVMASHYVKMYEEVLNGNSLNSKVPVHIPEMLQRDFPFYFD